MLFVFRYSVNVYYRNYYDGGCDAGHGGISVGGDSVIVVVELLKLNLIVILEVMVVIVLFFSGSKDNG